MGLRWAYVFLAAATTVVSVVAGDDYYDGFPAGDLVKGLPGQPISTAPFRQYAGYVDVDVENGKSFFYYFVESQKNPREAPLTLWSNGGPGCSSIGGGAFTELGPFFPSGDGRSLVVNSKSWNLVSNLLFVDYPAGVGWSYSNKSSDYSTKDETTSRDMFNFMLGWYGKFPSFRTRVLFLAGESYAGHYVPQLARRILSHNHSHHYFNLQGIAIGNPTLKVNRDIPAMYAYFWSHGLISDEIYRKITEQCDFEVYSYAGTENKTQFPCIKSLIKAYESVGNAYADIYGVIYDKCYPAIVEQELQHGRTATKMSYGVDVCKMYETSFYLNLPEVQKALHANRTKLPYKWSDCTGHSILKYKVKDKDTNMLTLLKEILDRRLRVWIYSGDQDSIVPLSGTRTCVRELAGDLKFNISVPYGPWFHEQQVGGWQIEYGNLLTFATVKGGAHMVPYTQPSKALHLFTTFVLGLRLPNTTNIN